MIIRDSSNPRRQFLKLLDAKIPAACLRSALCPPRAIPGRRRFALSNSTLQEPAPVWSRWTRSRKPLTEWKKQLTPEQFQIAAWQAGTERAGSGKYAYNHEDGLYHCICCDDGVLFDSKTKFESGTGWLGGFLSAVGSRKKMFTRRAICR